MFMVPAPRVGVGELEKKIREIQGAVFETHKVFRLYENA
jgi:hypothetical protein